MSKRMTETSKWEKPWYRKLSLKHKLLWNWLCDRCDAAGVIEVDWDLASFQIGEEVSTSDLESLDGRVAPMTKEKMYIPSFIEFQYGKLSPDCRPHAAVISLLRKHGIAVDGSEVNFSKAEIIGYPKGIDTHQDKDKDQDQDKTKTKKRKDRATLDELKEYAISLRLPASDGEHMFDYWESCGWALGKGKVLDWKAAFRTRRSKGWLPSLNNKPPEEEIDYANAPGDSVDFATWWLETRARVDAEELAAQGPQEVED
jgi:hypothetical protein